MKKISPYLNSFLESNQSFRFSTFQSAIIDYVNENKEFPEFNDDTDIPMICKGVIDHYRHIYSAKNNVYEKRFLISWRFQTN